MIYMNTNYITKNLNELYDRNGNKIYTDRLLFLDYEFFNNTINNLNNIKNKLKTEINELTDYINILENNNKLSKYNENNDKLNAFKDYNKLIIENIDLNNKINKLTNKINELEQDIKKFNENNDNTDLKIESLLELIK